MNFDKTEFDEKDEVDYPKVLRTRIWDELRKRAKITPEDFKNKRKLQEKYRKAIGAKHRQRLQGREKGIDKLLKSRFFNKLKEDVVGVRSGESGYIRSKPKNWVSGEKDVLKSLDRRYSGKRKVAMPWGKGSKMYSKNKAIIRQFREVTGSSRSEQSILTQLRRIRKTT